VWRVDGGARAFAFVDSKISKDLGDRFPRVRASDLVVLVLAIKISSDGQTLLY